MSIKEIRKEQEEKTKKAKEDSHRAKVKKVLRDIRIFGAIAVSALVVMGGVHHASDIADYFSKNSNPGVEAGTETGRDDSNAEYVEPTQMPEDSKVDISAYQNIDFDKYGEYLKDSDIGYQFTHGIFDEDTLIKFLKEIQNDSELLEIIAKGGNIAIPAFFLENGDTDTIKKQIDGQIVTEKVTVSGINEKYFLKRAFGFTDKQYEELEAKGKLCPFFVATQSYLNQFTDGTEYKDFITNFGVHIATEKTKGIIEPFYAKNLSAKGIKNFSNTIDSLRLDITGYTDNGQVGGFVDCQLNTFGEPVEVIQGEKGPTNTPTPGPTNTPTPTQGPYIPSTSIHNANQEEENRDIGNANGSNSYTSGTEGQNENIGNANDAIPTPGPTNTPTPGPTNTPTPPELRDDEYQGNYEIVNTDIENANESNGYVENKGTYQIGDSNIGGTLTQGEDGNYVFIPNATVEEYEKYFAAEIEKTLAEQVDNMLAEDEFAPYDADNEDEFAPYFGDGE